MQTSSSSSSRSDTRDAFHTSTRIRIKAYYSSNHSQRQIVRLLKEHHNVEISQATVSRIIVFAYDRRKHTKSERLRKISSRTTRYLARVITREWTKRRLTWIQLVKSIDLNVHVIQSDEHLKFWVIVAVSSANDLTYLINKSKSELIESTSINSERSTTEIQLFDRMNASLWRASENVFLWLAENSSDIMRIVSSQFIDRIVRHSWSEMLLNENINQSWFFWKRCRAIET
jgi:hypothetical protein